MDQDNFSQHLWFLLQQIFLKRILKYNGFLKIQTEGPEMQILLPQEIHQSQPGVILLLRKTAPLILPRSPAVPGDITGRTLLMVTNTAESNWIPPPARNLRRETSPTFLKNHGGRSPRTPSPAAVLSPDPDRRSLKALLLLVQPQHRIPGRDPTRDLRVRETVKASFHNMKKRQEKSNNKNVLKCILSFFFFF